MFACSRNTANGSNPNSRRVACHVVTSRPSGVSRGVSLLTAPRPPSDAQRDEAALLEQSAVGISTDVRSLCLRLLVRLCMYSPISSVSGSCSGTYSGQFCARVVACTPLPHPDVPTLSNILYRVSDRSSRRTTHDVTLCWSGLASRFRFNARELPLHWTCDPKVGAKHHGTSVKVWLMDSVYKLPKRGRTQSIGAMCRALTSSTAVSAGDIPLYF